MLLIKLMIVKKTEQKDLNVLKKLLITEFGYKTNFKEFTLLVNKKKGNIFLFCLLIN